MAIDNPSKRESVISTFGPYVVAMPMPDGEISQADRQHLASIFSGVLADPGGPVSEKLSRNRSIRPMPYQFQVFA